MSELSGPGERDPVSLQRGYSLFLLLCASKAHQHCTNRRTRSATSSGAPLRPSIDLSGSPPFTAISISRADSTSSRHEPKSITFPTPEYLLMLMTLANSFSKITLSIFHLGKRKLATNTVLYAVLAILLCSISIFLVKQCQILVTFSNSCTMLDIFRNKVCIPICKNAFLAVYG